MDVVHSRKFQPNQWFAGLVIGVSLFSQCVIQRMDVRFYCSRWSDREPPRYFPQIWVRDVVGHEVRAVLAHPGEDLPALDGARMALGQIKPGECYLRVIYVPDPATNSVFVISAFRLRGKVLKACRDRQRSRGHHHHLRVAPEVPQGVVPIEGFPTQEPFPAGWNDVRVRRVIDHYETQDETAAVAEDEAALEIAHAP